MNNITVVVCLLLSIVSCSVQRVATDIEIRDQIVYEVNHEKPFTGLYVVHWENGQKKTEVTLASGQKEGLLTSWYDDGQKSAEVVFKKT